MVHALYTRNLGRNSSWRKATVRSLAQALLKYERIETTLAKAKEAQRMTERLITLGKAADLAARRQAISLLGDSRLVHRLFSEVAPRFSKRAGGYTRIFHQGFRSGDGASLAVVELVELAPNLQLKEKEKTKKERVPEKLGKTEKQEKPEKIEKKGPEPKEKRESKEDPKASEPKKTEPEKPKSFVDGLRKFFKKERDQ